MENRRNRENRHYDDYMPQSPNYFDNDRLEARDNRHNRRFNDREGRQANWDRHSEDRNYFPNFPQTSEFSTPHHNDDGRNPSYNNINQTQSNNPFIYSPFIQNGQGIYHPMPVMQSGQMAFSRNASPLPTVS